MKATGIVRRIDDLGRVVIPKEIRRTMRIREGDPLEIYTNSEGEVIFKKYSAVSEMSENAGYVADIMHKIAGCPVLIFDKDHVVASAGVPRKEFAERRVFHRRGKLARHILSCGGVIALFHAREKIAHRRTIARAFFARGKDVAEPLFKQRQSAALVQHYHVYQSAARRGRKTAEFYRIRKQRGIKRKHGYVHAFALAELDAGIVFEKHSVRRKRGLFGKLQK